MLSTPCPACDQASAIDEEGCCVHCGTPRWEDSREAAPALTPCPACGAPDGDVCPCVSCEWCAGAGCKTCGGLGVVIPYDDARQAHLDSLLNLVCGHRAEFKEAYRYGPDAWCGHPDCRRYRERVGRAHD